MSDAYTEKLALFAGVEVKMSGAGDLEAKVQLALWMAAGLQCREQLLQKAGEEKTTMDKVPLFGWTVVGHQWDLYVGYVEPVEATEVRAVVSSPSFLSLACRTWLRSESVIDG